MISVDAVVVALVALALAGLYNLRAARAFERACLSAADGMSLAIPVSMRRRRDDVRWARKWREGRLHRAEDGTPRFAPRRPADAVTIDLAGTRVLGARHPGKVRRRLGWGRDILELEQPRLGQVEVRFADERWMQFTVDIFWPDDHD